MGDARESVKIFLTIKAKFNFLKKFFKLTTHGDTFKN